jgi:predicted O-methyltransferase YrrM
VGSIVPSAIERYLASLNRQRDPVLDEIERQGREAGVPCVDAEVGALLRVLATAVGARRILEVGAGVGYSAIWMARALPADGLLISFEIDAARARAATDHFVRAGVAGRAHVMLGDARRLVAKVAGPFDLIFNDGDKRHHEAIHERLVALLRPGGLLVTDNVLWDGEVVPGFLEKPVRPAEDTRAIAAHNEHLVSDPRLLTTIVPLRDGVAISVKVSGVPSAGW